MYKDIWIEFGVTGLVAPHSVVILYIRTFIEDLDNGVVHHVLNI